jgi:hypothetical protein
MSAEPVQPDAAAQLIEATAKLLSAVAWPVVVASFLLVFKSSIGRFIATLSEIRLKGRGFEASAVRRLDFDDISRKLSDFWKPDGKVDRTNATKIVAAMQELNIVGSIGWLINAATPEARAKVAERLKLNP